MEKLSQLLTYAVHLVLYLDLWARMYFIADMYCKYPELACGSSRPKFQWNWDTPGRFTWKVKENNPAKVNLLKLLSK